MVEKTADGGHKEGYCCDLNSPLKEHIPWFKEWNHFFFARLGWFGSSGTNFLQTIPVVVGKNMEVILKLIIITSKL